MGKMMEFLQLLGKKVPEAEIFYIGGSDILPPLPPEPASRSPVPAHP